MNKIFFISGVCGVGKTSIIPYLKKLLPQSNYEVYDFDARGVPENTDRKWRISETKHWMGKGLELIKKNKNLVVCGFTNPDEVKSPETIFILLTAQPNIIRQRLAKRYTKNGTFDKTQKIIGLPIKEFIDNNVQFAEKLENIFRKHNSPIIDTSKLSPEKVAQAVADIIIKN